MCPAKEKVELVKNNAIEQLDQDLSQVLTKEVLEKELETKIKQMRTSKVQRKHI